TARQIGAEQEFNSLNLVADLSEMTAQARHMKFNMNQDLEWSDPDPDPNQSAPAIADVYKVELLRDAHSGALRVEGTFRVLNAGQTLQSFEQEFGMFPGNFDKFVLPVP